MSEVLRLTRLIESLDCIGVTHWSSGSVAADTLWHASFGEFNFWLNADVRLQSSARLCSSQLKVYISKRPGLLGKPANRADSISDINYKVQFWLSESFSSGSNRSGSHSNGIRQGALENISKFANANEAFSCGCF